MIVKHSKELQKNMGVIIFSILPQPYKKSNYCYIECSGFNKAMFGNLFKMFYYYNAYK